MNPPSFISSLEYDACALPGKSHECNPLYFAEPGALAPEHGVRFAVAAMLDVIVLVPCFSF